MDCSLLGPVPNSQEICDNFYLSSVNEMTQKLQNKLVQNKIKIILFPN